MKGVGNEKTGAKSEKARGSSAATTVGARGPSFTDLMGSSRMVTLYTVSSDQDDDIRKRFLALRKRVASSEHALRLRIVSQDGTTCEDVPAVG